MQKLKSIVFVVGIMLLILAAAMGYLSIKYLSAILPADSYEDKGVYTFSPYQVLPIQVQNTGASGRDRRMNPTKKTPIWSTTRTPAGAAISGASRPSPVSWARKSWTQGPLWSGGCWRFPLTAPISPWSLARPPKAIPQDFGKGTSPPLYWREAMFCCM